MTAAIHGMAPHGIALRGNLMRSLLPVFALMVPAALAQAPVEDARVNSRFREGGGAPSLHVGAYASMLCAKTRFRINSRAILKRRVYP